MPADCIRVCRTSLRTGVSCSNLSLAFNAQDDIEGKEMKYVEYAYKAADIFVKCAACGSMREVYAHCRCYSCSNNSTWVTFPWISLLRVVTRFFKTPLGLWDDGLISCDIWGEAGGAGRPPMFIHSYHPCRAQWLQGLRRKHHYRTILQNRRFKLFIFTFLLWIGGETTT